MSGRPETLPTVLRLPSEALVLCGPSSLCTIRCVRVFASRGGGFDVREAARKPCYGRGIKVYHFLVKFFQNGRTP